MSWICKNNPPGVTTGCLHEACRPTWRCSMNRPGESYLWCTHEACRERAFTYADAVRSIPCDRCGGTGQHEVRADNTHARFEHLHLGVCTGYVDEPPSALIALHMNHISLLLPVRDEGAPEVCIHGLNPCITRCGVVHTRDPEGLWRWLVIPQAEREAWFMDLFSYHPQRRDMSPPCLCELWGPAPNNIRKPHPDCAYHGVAECDRCVGCVGLDHVEECPKWVRCL